MTKSSLLIFDCCCYRYYIPSELVAIIHSYYFQPILPTGIFDAIVLWESDNEKGILQHGHICDWNRCTPLEIEQMDLNTKLDIVEIANKLKIPLFLKKCFKVSIETIQFIVHEAGWIPHIVMLMCDQNQKVRTDAITLAAQIWNDLNGVIIYELGGVQAIFDALAVGNNTAVIISALDALVILYCRSKLVTVSLMRSESRVTRLCELLSHDEVKIRQGAANLISLLTTFNQTVQDTVYTALTMPQLLDLMRVEFDTMEPYEQETRNYVKQVRAVIKIISNFAFERKYATAMYSFDVCECLLYYVPPSNIFHSISNALCILAWMDPRNRIRIFELAYSLLITWLDPLSKFCSAHVIALVILITDEKMDNDHQRLMNDNARGMLGSNLQTQLFIPDCRLRSQRFGLGHERSEVGLPNSSLIIPFLVLLSKPEVCDVEERILASQYFLKLATIVEESRPTLREVGAVELLKNLIVDPHKEVRSNVQATLDLLST